MQEALRSTETGISAPCHGAQLRGPRKRRSQSPITPHPSPPHPHPTLGCVFLSVICSSY